MRWYFERESVWFLLCHHQRCRCWRSKIQTHTNKKFFEGVLWSCCNTAESFSSTTEYWFSNILTIFVFSKTSHNTKLVNDIFLRWREGFGSIAAASENTFEEFFVCMYISIMLLLNDSWYLYLFYYYIIYYIIFLSFLLRCVSSLTACIILR